MQEKTVMITREDIRELALFQTKHEAERALSFYFQPGTPQNKAHREDAILVKDVVRKALREAERNGKSSGVRADLERILEYAGSVPTNQTRGKAIFACAAQNFWREYDLPPRLSQTQLTANRRFYLKPLAVLPGARRRLAVVLVDRHRARLFDLRLDELTEREGLFRALPRRGRGDGYAGYDAGHAQRRVEDEVRQHYKAVADRLKEEADKGFWDGWILGCLDAHWHELEAHLHPYVTQRLVGRFSGEIAGLTGEQIRERAGEVVEDSLDRRRKELVHAVLGEARSNARGTTGLRRVLRSLEYGEVQALLIGQNYLARAVECTSCGHIDSHIVAYCPLCGRATRELEDVCEAIIPLAIRHDLELLYVDHPELDRVGNIGALLRFRSDHGKSKTIAIAS
jgi:peptide chain release factor subunit 1